MVDIDLSEQIGLTEAEDEKPAARKRVRGKIEFPYSDLSRAVDLCTALMEIAGTAAAEQTQLAVKLDMSANGGTFRGRLSAARMFGLIEVSGGTAKLTDLGRDVVDTSNRKTAMAAAFLEIELYREMYNRYNGYALPPAAALERQMRELGVPPKQSERARQAFISSAETANYIADNGRFIKPALAAKDSGGDNKDKKEEREDGGAPGGGGGSGGGDGGNLHPFVQGLLQTLPEPGSQWPASARADWLQAAATMFKLIYKGDGEVKIESASKKAGDQ